VRLVGVVAQEAALKLLQVAYLAEQYFLCRKGKTGGG